MDMNMNLIRQLPSPEMIKAAYPLPKSLVTVKKERDEAIKAILSGNDNRMLLIIGPCSADREDAVLEYISKLVPVQEKVSDKFLIIPRIYTNKPRTTGDGYKGIATQPDPTEQADMVKGMMSVRELHTKAFTETGFTCADEMLYPENHSYLSDLLAYVTVGARSVENQQHRLVASGINIPVGMKNPTSGDYGVMLNSITAAQHPHTFSYRGWEVETPGNPLTHAILRGYVNKHGQSHPNYHYEDLELLRKMYAERNLNNCCVICDTNHSNSGKDYLAQIRIAKEILHSCRIASEIRTLVKGLMVESYLEDGAQKIGDGIYGKSITDPCLGWDKTERLIYELADLL